MGIKKNKVDVVIPLYNCESSIHELVRRIENTGKIANLAIQLYLIDDGSNDKTWNKILELNQVKSIRIHALRLSRNYGQHAAILAALKESSGEIVIIMDGDLQDKPEDIPRFVSKLIMERLDVVRGVLTNADHSFNNWRLNYVFHKLRGGSGRETSFRAISQKLREALVTEPEAHEISGLIIDSLGFKQGEIEIERNPKDFGTRYTIVKRIDMALSFLITRSKALAYAFLTLAVVVGLFSLAYAGLLVMEVLLFGNGLPPGLNQIVLLLVMQMMLLTVGIAILILLCFRILKFAKNSPSFHVMERWRNGL